MNWLAILGLIFVVIGWIVFLMAFKKDDGLLAWKGKTLVTVATIIVIVSIIMIR